MLVNFGLEDTIDGWWDVLLPIGAMYHIAADRRIPDYTLHGVLRVTICSISSGGSNGQVGGSRCVICFSPF